MPNNFITPFEVLAQPVAPVPDVPYVQQGFFLEVSNLGASAATVTLLFNPTPAFVATSGAVSLFANIIDQTGVPKQFSVPEFLIAPVGFTPMVIPAGVTWLFGVQYLLLPEPGMAMLGSTPQASAGTRGNVVLSVGSGSELLLLATIRQVFNNYNPAGTLIDVSESAYALPLVGGPLLKT